MEKILDSEKCRLKIICTKNTSSSLQDEESMGEALVGASGLAIAGYRLTDFD